MTNTGEQLILITDIAVEKFQELLFDADKRDSYLKIAIALEGTQMHYAIDIKDEVEEGDKVYNFGELKVLKKTNCFLKVLKLTMYRMNLEVNSHFTILT